MTPYEILGVEKFDSLETIRAAFRRLAQKHHPDREGGDLERFREVNLAFATIMRRQICTTCSGSKYIEVRAGMGVRKEPCPECSTS